MIRIGTRGSKLALAQSGLIADEIARLTGEQVTLVEIKTTGDGTSVPVAQLGVGVFVNQLREALEREDIDIAVHSYKDLPTAQPEHLVIAVPPREDPRDVLIASEGRTLSDLGPGAKIGTGSPRRIAQLNALGRGFECVPIRGNIDTRIGRVGADLDGVILAAAGLRRVGRQDEVTEYLDPLVMLPAPAQGALAVECRKADMTSARISSMLNDRYSQAAVAAERALLQRLEAGCSAPVAALADVAESAEPGEVDLYLRGAVGAVDGSVVERLSTTAALSDASDQGVDDLAVQAAAVGKSLAEDLLESGAEQLLKLAASCRRFC
ncbi:hydroxymethylbilane synthase [Glycomyces sp. TRM65418]|uniref:hydroxymethylbilane synthase n=1 Tax=Glycomyces sp. TRM65418 TaxID=2867006 RepID=UPI001CE57C5F|nr:hydroxymethylbilane synthase [Glycomyces sp. TRM65418]MCC3763532.1 hydroxymethylbilane synthase [Glycomyces sp. TRM65418]QZD57515.1 hydroxymethylbilane synthase [Glycomyces sp. TRM65418]